MADEANTGGFWRTLPGVLTATAGLLTAVGGLVIALSQSGVLRRPGAESTRAETARRAPADTPPATTSTPAGSAAGPPVAPPPATSPPTASPPAAPRALPVAGLQAKVAESVFRVVAAELAGVGDGQSELRLRVQVENTNPASYMSVSDFSFRLRLPGGMPQPPAEEVGWTSLDPTSGREFTVVFAVPDTARAARLTFHHDQRGADRTVALDLAAAAR